MAALLPDTDSEDELAAGWEERATLDGKVYYANHINEKTTYTDPRLAFAVEEKDSPTDIRQRFDASSTALQVLHGRDLSNKVAIITGANTGIGYETARSLAYHGCEIFFACRNEEKTMAAINKIKTERPNANLHFMKLDLSQLQGVKDFCNTFTETKKPINMLILNAGMFGAPHTLTEDGYEMTFQVNHLGHFYLVQLLRPLLVQPCRVVVVSSESHRFSNLTAGSLSEEKLSPTVGGYFFPMGAYNNSKLCNVLFANELNRRLSPKRVFCNSLHPGNLVSSDLSRNWWFYRVLFAVLRPFTKSLQQAAATTVFCATAYDLDGAGGMYFNNCCRCQPSSASEDEAFAKLLWDISEAMIERALSRKKSVSSESSCVSR